MPLLVMSKRDGDVLRESREVQVPRMSQRDVARMLGIPEERYRSYEYGRVRLPKAHALTLASAWGIPWASLYADERTATTEPIPRHRQASLAIGPALLDLMLDALENPLTPKAQKDDIRQALREALR